MCIHTHTHTHMHMHTYTHRMLTRAHRACTHTWACAHTQAHTQTFTYSHIHSHFHGYSETEALVLRGCLDAPTYSFNLFLFQRWGYWVCCSEGMCGITQHSEVVPSQRHGAPGGAAEGTAGRRKEGQWGPRSLPSQCPRGEVSTSGGRDQSVTPHFLWLSQYKWLYTWYSRSCIYCCW